MLFLVLFLFYCAYFMLRFSVEPGPRRERLSAVYALFGVVLIPVSFLAIRLAANRIHPTVFTRETGLQMSGSIFAIFCLSWLRSVLSGLRDVSRRAARQAHRRESPRAARGADVSSGEKYVAATYGVVGRLRARLGGDHRDEARAARARDRGARRGSSAIAPMAEFLIWPVLIAYGEAAFAYVGELRGPGLGGRLATWGVRIGWLAQTALLVSAGRRRSRVSLGDVGRRSEPPLVARRHGLPRVGLQAALPASGPRGDAICRGAACGRVGRRRNGRCRARRAGRAAGGARRLHACGPGRVHDCSGDGGSVPLGRAPVETARLGFPPAPRAVARGSRSSCGSRGSDLPGRAHRWHRRRSCEFQEGRLRPGDGRQPRDLGPVRHRADPPSRRSDFVAGGLPGCCSPVLRLRSSCSRSRTSRHEACTRRRIAPECADRAAGSASRWTSPAPAGWRQSLATGAEAVVLSTCNRTELYLAADAETELESRADEALRRLAGDGADALGPVVYRLADESAALHLFRVAAGLDSLVPGEGEILGQVRDAYDAGAAGPLLDGSSGWRCTSGGGPGSRRRSARARRPSLRPPPRWRNRSSRGSTDGVSSWWAPGG